ncbi:PD-(D/E)XK nuclease family protein [Aliterella atlantica]|uniref:DNA/RNA helicase n=1 Tax=Aliterella atlantica CENA595 TaxID=1618023 RepID=A0A0D8ZQF0_9CYAN|nr:PD-(D/E)XK nuclease family protein [Aliterella atlantica]KJH70577.1 DNA/RNA helicase [Aliterella atlantica CENA595]
MRLSQGQLNILERCPRQFQHTYLEQLGSPTNLEQQERLSSGSRFHLLMQQRELGLPIDALVKEDAQLQRWMNAFAGAASEILSPNSNSNFRESEHCRTLQIEEHLLTVIYDLLIASDRTCQILDWKTYPKPQNRSKLGQNWQTLLYLYVLAQTSEYLPEQMSMTYWFVQSEDKPQSSTFTYNNTQHQQTGQKLNRLLTQLTKWLEHYEQGEPFPQVANGSRECEYCQFVTRCDRDRYDKEESINQNWLSNLADIQELSL